jgi:deoxyribodipyrimidine photo-lyase
MHNRLRMIVAMFLSKQLLIDWRRGERFFMQHLLDGHLASNNGGWQWAASTGTDAVPYFRIFNPVTQSQRFDPTGEFIKHYVPELAEITGKDIHLPTEAARTLHAPDYPKPIVDLKLARERALSTFSSL